MVLLVFDKVVTATATAVGATPSSKVALAAENLRDWRGRGGVERERKAVMSQ